MRDATTLSVKIEICKNEILGIMIYHSTDGHLVIFPWCVVSPSMMTM